MTSFTLMPTPIRTWQAITYITNAIEIDGIDDLSPKMQDTIMAAVDKLAAEVELPLKVVACECDEDHDALPSQPRYFLRITVSEVVAGVKQGRTN